MAMHKHNSEGFTLIELLLAMTFFTFILLFITAGFIHISRVYQSGVITKNAQNTLRDIFENLNRDARSGTDVQAPVTAGSLSCYTIGQATYGYDATNYELYRGSEGASCSVADMQKIHEDDLRVYAFEFVGVRSTPSATSPSSARVNVLIGVADGSLLTGSGLSTTCDPSPLTLRLCSVVSLTTAVTLRGDS